jgi:hypothetical protein
VNFRFQINLEILLFYSYECMRVPESLTRWLKCVKWSSRDDVLEVKELIILNILNLFIPIRLIKLLKIGQQKISIH